MSLVIRDTATVPPEDWTFPIDQTGFTVRTKNYAMLFVEIAKHCKANNISEPSEQTVIDFICNSAHVPCYNSETREPLINAWSLNLPVPAPRGCCGG